MQHQLDLDAPFTEGNLMIYNRGAVRSVTISCQTTLKIQISYLFHIDYDS